MMLRIAGALTEVALGLVLAVVALAAARGRRPQRRVQAAALAAGGVAIAVWGVGEALRGPTGGALQLGGLAVLVVAAAVVAATTPET